MKLIRLINEKDVPANTLSHGQRQWLEIGLLIGNNVKLLLLDEPTAGMTTEETIATTKLINNLSGEKNLSIIVIEHDINFVRELGAQITVLHLGKIFADKTLINVDFPIPLRPRTPRMELLSSLILISERTLIFP